MNHGISLRHSSALFPRIAVRNFILFSAILVAALWGTDHWLVPALEARYQIAGRLWAEENRRINQNNEFKHPTGGDPIWSSPGHPASRNARRKTNRIAIIGDSFVWGGGYANVNDIWWRQLERVLEERGYSDVEVIALGYRGASGAEMLNYAKAYLGQYHPDLVIWGYVTNDPAETHTDGEGAVNQITLPPSPAYARVRQWAHRLLPNVFYLFDQRYVAKQQELAKGPAHGYPYFEWELRILEGPSFESYKQTVAATGEYLRSLQVPSFMITLPNRPDSAFFGPRLAPVLPVFAAAQIPVVDTLPAFVRRFGEHGQYFTAALAHAGSTAEPFVWGINPADGHPSAVATRFYAEMAADYLEANHKGVLGAVSPRMRYRPQINDWNPGTLTVTKRPNGVSFAWPTSSRDKELMLSMPTGRPYIQLNFERPVALQALHIEGSNLLGARLAITQVDEPGGWDRNLPIDLGQRSGALLTWDTRALALRGAVHTVRIEAEFSDPAQGELVFSWDEAAP